MPRARVVWIRVRLHERLSRLAHAVDLYTGELACGLGRVVLEPGPKDPYRQFERDDSHIARCEKCVEVV